MSDINENLKIALLVF